MKILIRKAFIVDVASRHHLKQRDILIENGVITKIAPSVKGSEKFTEVKAKGLKVSPGWVDMHANFCDPGFEHKEDLISGANAAAAGGFTTVAVLPETNPAIESKSFVEYVINKTQQHIVDVLSLGALSKKLEGHEPTEIYDMHKAGAVAFTDGLKPSYNTASLIRNLEYLIPFNGLLMSFPKEFTIGGMAGLNEGVVSLKMGLNGQPVLAEEMAVQKEIKAAGYANSRLHFIQISTKAAVEHIKAAKRKNVSISCAVSPYHLIFDELAVASFDANYKIEPPLRTKQDNRALIKALKDGTIDVISCLHWPEDVDGKRIEFENAACGISGLQTTYALLKTYLYNDLDDALIVEKMATNPRKLLGLPTATIEANNNACITLFNEEAWTLTTENNKSKAANNPFFNKPLKGKVIGIINNNQLLLN